MGEAKSRGNQAQRVMQALGVQSNSGLNSTPIYMRTNVAALGQEHVRDFCKTVDSGSQPVSVRCSPVFGAINDCFPQVERRVIESGGNLVLGWAIWEITGQLIEAELHAVWQKPDGQLLDIASRPIRFDSITFLPDTKRLSYARQIDSIRQPLNSDPRILEFISLLSQKFAVLNEGDLADQTGIIDISAETERKLQRINTAIARLPLVFL